MEEKIASHVQCLVKNGNKSDILTSLQELVVIVDSGSIDKARLVTLIPLDLLFRCLTSDSHEDVTKLCTILLKKLLYFVKPHIVICEHKDAALQGLNHPSEDVREICLIQIERCAQTMQGVHTILSSTDLLNFIIRSLADSHAGCAKLACSTLVSISKDSDGTSLLFDGSRQAEFEAVMAKNDTARFRVYELFVKIVQTNMTKFSQAETIFHKIISEIDSSDILLQMNAIELLSDIVDLGDDGMQLPEKSGVNNKLYDILKEPESNPLSSLLVPAIIKFFGVLSMKKPYMIAEKYPLFFTLIFNTISNHDGSLIILAVDTIATIASSDVGLTVLFPNETRCNILRKIGYYLSNGDENLRVHCLDCLSCLFTCRADSDNNILDLIHNLYLKLDTNPLDLLYQILKQPFHKIRMACFKTFYSLVSYQWMLEDIKNIPGFFEYLLDRRTESEKECQEMKYEVVKKITTSSYVTVIFDKPSLLKLKQFVRDGPFYLGSDVSVAMQGTQ